MCMCVYACACVRVCVHTHAHMCVCAATAALSSKVDFPFSWVCLAPGLIFYLKEDSYPTKPILI